MGLVSGSMILSCSTTEPGHPQGRSVREQALAFRSELVEAMGLSAADFHHLRAELVKLRENLSVAERASP